MPDGLPYAPLWDPLQSLMLLSLMKHFSLTVLIIICKKKKKKEALFYLQSILEDIKCIHIWDKIYIKKLTLLHCVVKLVQLFCGVETPELNFSEVRIPREYFKPWGVKFYSKHLLINYWLVFKHRIYNNYCKLILDKLLGEYKFSHVKSSGRLRSNRF